MPKFKVPLVTYKSTPYYFQCEVEAPDPAQALELAKELGDEPDADLEPGEGEFDGEWHVCNDGIIEAATFARIEELIEAIQGEGCEDTCEEYKDELRKLRATAWHKQAE